MCGLFLGVNSNSTLTNPLAVRKAFDALFSLALSTRKNMVTLVGVIPLACRRCRKARITFC